MGFRMFILPSAASRILEKVRKVGAVLLVSLLMAGYGMGFEISKPHWMKATRL